MSSSDNNVGCPVDKCSLEVDVHIVSSDSVTIGAHSKNLALFGNGFPSEKVIHLEEWSGVLQLLLRFMHHTRQPDLSTTPFSTLFSLAEAAEKYRVYPAMGNCKTQLGHHISQDPIQIWMYAVKYDYPSLADKAAYLTLNCSPTQLMIRAKEYELSMARVVQWNLYREQWSQVLKSVLKSLTLCGHWDRFQFNINADIGDQLTMLTAFGDIVKKHMNILDPVGCASCRSRLERWRHDILEEIKFLQKYSHSDFTSEPLKPDIFPNF